MATSSMKFAASMVVFAGLHAAVVVDALATKSISAAIAQGSQDTLATLDTNHNGKVEKSEIEAFARSQGMSPEDVMGDFKEIDTNGDGELDASEIAAILGETDSQQQQQQQPATNSQPLNVVAQTPIATAAQTSPANIAVAESPVTVASAPSPAVPILVSAASPQQADSSNDLQNLQQNAGLEAGRIVATKFTSIAQQLMKKSAADASKAAAFEKQAQALRGKAKNLLKSATEDTRRLAVGTAAKVGDAAKPQMEHMKVEAEQLEKKAGEQRTLAHKALEQVSKDQSLMATLFQHSASA
jgi:hypothetical protein